MAKGNPNPVITPEFKNKIFKPQGEPGEELAEKTVQVRLTVSQDAYVRMIPNRSEWMRHAIAEAIKKESKSNL